MNARRHTPTTFGLSSAPKGRRLRTLAHWAALAAAVALAALLAACGGGSAGDGSAAGGYLPTAVPPELVTQLTTTGSNYLPQINNAGDVVWYGSDGNDLEVYRYDAAAGTVSPVTNNDVDDSYPVINNAGQVFWHDHEQKGTLIYRQDPGAEEPTVLLDDIQVSSRIDANDAGDVVWYGGNVPMSHEIYLRTADGTVTRITNNTLGDDDPALNNTGLVVWWGADRTLEGDAELFRYDAGSDTTTQLTDNAFHDEYPDLNDAGQVVWFRTPVSVPGVVDVYRYDPATDTTVNLSNSPENSYFPRINAHGDVVWYQWDGNDYEIMLYRADTDTVEAVTDNDYSDFYPAINDNGAIAWVGRVTPGQEEIFLYSPTPPQPPNQPPVADAGDDLTAVVGFAVQLSGSGSDPDGDDLTYAWSLTSRPAGSAATLANDTTATPTLTPDLPGTYVAQLVVNDGLADSAPDTVSIEASSVEDAVDEGVETLDDTADGLDPGAFKNPNMQNALSNKIAAVMSMIDAGQYAQALAKLQSDILGKTDGCATGGAPDHNDWILTCAEQGQLYPVIQQLIAWLTALL